MSDEPLDPEATARMLATVVRLAEMLNITVEDAATIFVKVGRVLDPAVLRKVQ